MSSVHQRKRDLRIRLTGALRSLAGLQKNGKIAQVFLDLSCRVASAGDIDQSKLPATPDGFVLRQSRINSRVPVETLCLYQVVSMMVLYYWLFARMHDPQDRQSCEYYLKWLETYNKAPETYNVAGDVRNGYFLHPAADGLPHLPEWLGEETV